MSIIYLCIKTRLLVSAFLIGLVATTTTYAGRLDDGPVIVKIQNDNLCFSVSKYKPRGSFFKSYKIADQGLLISSIIVSKFQKETIWGQNLSSENSKYEISLKSDQCIDYGTYFKGYNHVGSQQNLDSGKYRVVISGYDPSADRGTAFLTIFSIDVTNGKITLK